MTDLQYSKKLYLQVMCLYCFQGMVSIPLARNGHNPILSEALQVCVCRVRAQLTYDDFCPAMQMQSWQSWQLLETQPPSRFGEQEALVGEGTLGRNPCNPECWPVLHMMFVVDSIHVVSSRTRHPRNPKKKKTMVAVWVVARYTRTTPSLH